MELFAAAILVLIMYIDRQDMQMTKKSTLLSDQKDNKKMIPLEHNIVFIIFATLILFIESILIIIFSFRRGIYKQEILSSKSNLGFDIDIIMK